MMLPIAGTIRNSVKLAELDNKWQERKNKAGNTSSQQIDPQIQQFQEDLKRMREGSVMGSIDAKLRSGAELTSEEIEYLKKNNPEAYKDYLEMKAEREAYKKQLRSCRTKDDVQKLKMNKMGSFMAEAKTIINNPNIPKGEKLKLVDKILRKTMGIQSEHMKFVESKEYKEMPTEAEVAEEIIEEKVNSEVSKIIEEPDNEDQAEEVNEAEGLEEDSEMIDDVRKKPAALPELTQKADTEFHEIWATLGEYLKTSAPSLYAAGYGENQTEVTIK